MFTTKDMDTELRFATKKFTTNDMKNILANQGWEENHDMKFASKKFTMDDMAGILEGQGWVASKALKEVA